MRLRCNCLAINDNLLILSRSVIMLWCHLEYLDSLTETRYYLGNMY